MENNQPTNPFDAMLKQSLEGAKIPVPSGVWETVGSSIGSNTLVAAKLSGIKWLLIKSFAGIILGSASLYGIYVLMQPKTQPKEINNVSNPAPEVTSEASQIENETVSKNKLNKDFNRYTAPSDNTIISPLYTDIDSIIDRINEVNQPTDNSNNRNSNNANPPYISIEPININPEPLIAHKKEEKSEVTEPISKAELEASNKPIYIEPSNVFTPDGDGLNDYFIIEVENEKAFVLQIFDESGKKVFESTDKNKYWDGKNMYNGEACKKGYYYYKLMVEFNNGFMKKESRGISLF
jgi:gliding motility-associated-like protein